MERFGFFYQKVGDIASKQESRRTDVTQQAVSLDSFITMNVTYAKQSCTAKTMHEVFMFINVQFQ